MAKTLRRRILSALKSISWRRVGIAVALLGAPLVLTAGVVILTTWALQHLAPRHWVMLIVGAPAALCAYLCYWCSHSESPRAKRARPHFAIGTAALLALEAIIVLLGSDPLWCFLAIAALVYVTLLAGTYVQGGTATRTGLLLVVAGGSFVVPMSLAFPDHSVRALAAATAIGLLAFALIDRLRARRRRREIARLAARLGLHFDPAPRYYLPAQLPQFGLVGGAGWVEINNLVHGRVAGHQVMAFDCRPKASRPRDLAYLCSPRGERELCAAARHVSFPSAAGMENSFSAAAVILPAPCPHMMIRPEYLMDRLAAAVGLGDLDLERDDFNRKYYVKARDRRLAYAILTPAVMELLMGPERITLEFAGNAVILWNGRRWRPEKLSGRQRTTGHPNAYSFEEAIEVLCGVLDRVPGYVWKDLARTRKAG
jgi:hypothetical protein